MVFFLPETSAPTILYYEAKRRREETGKKDLVSEAELKQRDLHVGVLLWDALVKPWVLNAKDPALGFTAPARVRTAPTRCHASLVSKKTLLQRYMQLY